MEVGQVNDNRFISTLKSSNATLVVLVLALFAQIPHAADVFRLIPFILSGDEQDALAWYQYVLPFVHSYLFAVALELAVLLFVVRHKQYESYGFAAASVAMNLAYYHLHGVGLFSTSAIPAWLVSFSLPAAIALYSHAVADAQDEQPQRTPRAIKTVRQSERTERLTVYAEQLPEQSVVIEAEQSDDLTTASDEQKRRYLAELLASGERLNKTQLAKQFAIGRTTLYAWIEELSPSTMEVAQ
jgi:hypothetical protein